jgi:hypothetical protein
VTAAPPRTYLRSRTRTFLPACARYAALTKPLWPPPITMTSYRFAMDLRDETCGILRAAEVEAFYKRQHGLTTRNLTRLDCESRRSRAALSIDLRSFRLRLHWPIDRPSRIAKFFVGISYFRNIEPCTVEVECRRLPDRPVSAVRLVCNERGE